MSEFGLGKSESEQTQAVNIPDFLRPFVEGNANLGSRTINQLFRLANRGEELIAGFDPLETLGQQLGVDRLFGEGGFLPMAQQALMDTAGGRDLNTFLPPGVAETLTGGGGFGGGLPDDVTATLTDAAANPGIGLDQLEATARGDFLYGGDGFNAAVDAAVNAALPQIRTVFGRAGAGGSTGGLAQTAVGDAAVREFARQYGSERRNQMGAADRLMGRSMDSAGLLSTAAGRNLEGARTVAGLADSERARAESAARALPGLAMFEPEALMGIGSQIRGLEQSRLDAPMQAQLALLQAIYGGLPIEALLGQTVTGDSRSANLLFG